MAGEGQAQGAHESYGVSGRADEADQERGVLADLVEVGWLPLVPLFMATGVALVVHVTVGMSLALAAMAAVAIFLGVFVARWLRLPLAQRAEAKRRAAVGAIAGAAGTAGYDAIRAAHVVLADLRFRPFDTLEVVGTALVGEGRPLWMIMTAGVGFHVTIGVGLAAAYTLFLRRPNVMNGIVFGFVIGSFTVVIIPNWLGTEGVFLEFLAVTSVGYLVYGTVVGLVAQWLAGRWHHADEPRAAEGVS